MDIIILDIFGKFAHFRKFYTNSSSLSYSVPTRTNLEGLLGAILGFERDSYYEFFSKDKLNIGVRKLSKTRNIMQSLNYIKATSINALVTPKEHTQIPFEIVTGEKNVAYRIYINHINKQLMDEIYKRIKEKRYVYAPYLGAAPFNCRIECVDRVEGVVKSSSEPIEISTVIKAENIEKCHIDVAAKNLFLTREKMPSEILKGRIINEINTYIYDENCSALKVNLRSNFLELNYRELKENIVFL